MFIEVLAVDGKSGLINENEVMAIQPNSYDDKAKLVLVSKAELYSALSYAQLVRRLTAATVSVAIEGSEEPKPRECQFCGRIVERNNFRCECGAVLAKEKRSVAN
jgi:hypothetical protein